MLCPAYMYTVTFAGLFGRAPTVWCNGVMSDARMGAPTPTRVAGAKMIKTGKPEAASPAAEGPTPEHRLKEDTELTLSAGGA